jgi:hypothetical protein
MSTADGTPPHSRPTIKALDAPGEFEDVEATRPEGKVLDADTTGDTGVDVDPPPLAHEIEVHVIHERSGGRPSPWRAVEIWTENRIYAVDGSMRCVAVIDRGTSHPDDKHSFLGARLIGGEHKDGEGNMAFSHPLPTPGHEAVFQVASATRGRYGHTSPVERVLLRIRVTHASLEGETDAVWEEITSTARAYPV